MTLEGVSCAAVCPRGIDASVTVSKFLGRIVQQDTLCNRVWATFTFLLQQLVRRHDCIE